MRFDYAGPQTTRPVFGHRFVTMQIAAWLTQKTVPCWNLTEEHLRMLHDRLPGHTVVRCTDSATFKRELPQTDIALVWVFKQSWLELTDRLKWIVTPAAGRDYFKLTPPPGVELVYGSFHGPLMAETVLGMMLGHCRGLFHVGRFLRDDPWPIGQLAHVMQPLRGSRLTVLGFGSIGRWIGKLAHNLGVHVTGVNRRGRGRPDWFDDDDRLVDSAHLDDVLPTTDHLALALPRTPETDGILDARRLALLPSSAALYNVGRGNAIDEEALARALSEGALSAAYLDVFREEPLPADSPLRSLANCFVFPHASAVSPNYLELFLDEFVERFRRRFDS